jgi:hypothetical protein
MTNIILLVPSNPLPHRKVCIILNLIPHYTTLLSIYMVRMLTNIDRLGRIMSI